MRDLVHEKVERAEGTEDRAGDKKRPGFFSKLKPAVAALAVAAAVGTGACSDEFGAQLPPLQDAGHEEDGGSGGDGGMDAGTGGDGGMDAGTGGDGGMDAGMDGGGGDGGMDAGPTACVSVMAAAPWTGNIANGATQTHGGYGFTYLGPDGGGNALFDIGCEGQLRYDNYAFPEDMVTTLNVAIDGRTLKVTPHAVAAGATNITLEVQ